MRATGFDKQIFLFSVVSYLGDMVAHKGLDFFEGGRLSLYEDLLPFVLSPKSLPGDVNLLYNL